MGKQEDIRRVVGENVRQLREASGKSTAELSESIGMSRAFWSEIEKGTKDPSTSTLVRLAQALGVNPQDLLLEPPKRKKAS